MKAIIVKLVCGICTLSISNSSFADSVSDEAYGLITSAKKSFSRYITKKADPMPKEMLDDNTCQDSEKELLSSLKSITFANEIVKSNGAPVTRTLLSRATGGEFCEIETEIPDNTNVKLDGKKDILGTSCHYKTWKYDEIYGESRLKSSQESYRESYQIRIMFSSNIGPLVYKCTTNFDLSKLIKDLSEVGIKLDGQNLVVGDNNYKDMSRLQLLNKYQQTKDPVEQAKIRGELFMLNSKNQPIQSARLFNKSSGAR